MKTSKWPALTVVAVVAAVGLMTWTSPAAGSRALRRAAHVNRLAQIKENLDLTDAQVARIESILKADKANLKNLLTRLREAQSGLRTTIQSAGATEESVRVASAKVAAAESDLAVERLKLRGEIVPILTDEQRAKFDQLQNGIGNFMGEKLKQRREQAPK